MFRFRSTNVDFIAFRHFSHFHPKGKAIKKLSMEIVRSHLGFRAHKDGVCTAWRCRVGDNRKERIAAVWTVNNRAPFIGNLTWRGEQWWTESSISGRWSGMARKQKPPQAPTSRNNNKSVQRDAKPAFELLFWKFLAIVISEPCSLFILRLRP